MQQENLNRQENLNQSIVIWEHRLSFLVNIGFCSIFSLAFINQFDHPHISNGMSRAGGVLMIFFLLFPLFVRIKFGSKTSKAHKQEKICAKNIEFFRTQIKALALQENNTNEDSISSRRMNANNDDIALPAPLDNEANENLRSNPDEMTVEALTSDEGIEKIEAPVQQNAETKKELEEKVDKWKQKRDYWQTRKKKTGLLATSGYLCAMFFLVLMECHQRLSNPKNMQQLKYGTMLISIVVFFYAADQLSSTIKKIIKNRNAGAESENEGNNRNALQGQGHKIVDLVFLSATITGTAGLWLNFEKVSHFNSGSSMMKIFISVALFGAVGMLFKTVYNAHQEGATLKDLSPSCC